MFLDDEFGDVVEAVYYEDTMELSILSGALDKQVVTGVDAENNIVKEGMYEGGMVLDKENAKRLVRRTIKWLGPEFLNEA